MRRRQRAFSIRVQIARPKYPKTKHKTDVMMVIFSSVRATGDARRSGSQAADRPSETVTGQRPQGMKLHGRKQVALTLLRGQPKHPPNRLAFLRAREEMPIARQSVRQKLTNF